MSHETDQSTIDLRLLGGASTLKGMAGSPPNLANASVIQYLSSFDDKVLHGVVVRAGAGSYDVAVHTGQRQVPIACSIAQACVHPAMGTSECTIPIEGSRVLVFVNHMNLTQGIIIAVDPFKAMGIQATEDDQIPDHLVHLWDYEAGAGYGTEMCYEETTSNPKTTAKVDAGSCRPLDLLPGNKAWINEQGVGMAILNLLLSLKASDRSRIDMSCVDDMLRIVSGYFQHISSQGVEELYNDGGRVTHEISGTLHQCEKSGFNALGSPLTEDTGFDESYLYNGELARYPFVQDEIVPKKRFQIYLGYLGDLFNLFIAKPDPAINPETQSSPNQDQGLMHTHIDGSGFLHIRSAAGFSFERSDRIPVPKKKFPPWDPEGDKMEDIEEVPSKDPFKFSTIYPFGRALQMQDAMAWRSKLAYQRLSEQSESEGKKDYYLPEEQDMKTPDDQYDSVAGSSAEFQKNAYKRAYFNLEPDGSIILRDAWGGSIIMRGGNIIIECPGQIEVRPGKSLVALAGHDVIAKAMKSVDITARDHDVRIKANVNLQMVSEGRSGPDAPGGGGIVLESKSPSDSANFSGTGEKARGSGIVLKAENSRVYAFGKTVHLASLQQTILEGKDAGGKAVSTLRMAMKDIVAIADRNMMLSVEKGAGLIMSRRIAYLAALNAGIVGGRRVAILRGAKAWVPLTEVDVPNYYDVIKERFTEQYDLLIGAEQWLQPFVPSIREDIKFTYRSSSEYGTVTATEVEGASKFAVYQSVWADLKAKGLSVLGSVQIDTWTEYPIEDTFPWPGAEVYNGGEAYVKANPASEGSNIEDGAHELPKKRKELSDAVDTLEAQSFHEYEVVKSV